MNQQNNYKPLLLQSFTNYLTWRKATIKRFQGLRFVFTIQMDKECYKMFQIVFGQKDGAVYVNLPYFQETSGIVAAATLPPFVRSANLELANYGKVTSHLIKYAHHPDGEAHFSQDGKVLTKVRNKTKPLAEVDGHLFSIRAQGLSHFEKAITKNEQPPKLNRTVLNFDMTETKSDSFAFIANWYETRNVLARIPLSHRGGEFGPSGFAETPTGQRMPFFLIGTPQRSPFEKYSLVVSCCVIPPLDKNREAILSFMGGFDPKFKYEDWTQRYSFLTALYPCSNADDLKVKIGSIDLN